MEAAELFLKDGRSAGVFYCGACKIVRRTEAEAKECCAPRLCECGAVMERGYTRCQACQSAAYEARDAATWEKAEKIAEADYDGPVYDDHRQRFYSDMGDALDSILDDTDEGEEPALDRLYACHVLRLELDLEQALDDALERTEVDPSEADLEWDGAEELQAFVAAWNARQTATWWEPDYSRGILVTAPTATEAACG